MNNQIKFKGYDTYTLDRNSQDYLQNSIISNKILDETIKFHQSTTWILDKNIKSNFFSPNTLSWVVTVENTDIIPNYIEEEITFEIQKRNFIRSHRAFDKDWKIGRNELGNLLYSAFGRSEDYPSKRYPSAGALYPVMPLIYIFKEEIVEGVKPGAFIYDGTNPRLIRIKDWTNEEMDEIKEAINPYEEVHSFLAIGYAIDIKRAITKYRKRGYRHALIEVGLMAQGFKEALIDFRNGEFAEVSWSGFNDNRVTYLSGLNVRLAPVTLLQFFGKKLKG